MGFSLSFVGQNVKLRAMEPEDVDILVKWENDPDLSASSNSFQPVSRKILHDYIEQSHRSLFEIGQMRLMIEAKGGETVGAVDLYDFDAYQRRVTIGILVDKEHRLKGYAKDALNVMSEYLLSHLCLYQIVAKVASSNTASCRLFESCQYEFVATLPQWQWIGQDYQDMKVYRKRGL